MSMVAVVRRVCPTVLLNLMLVVPCRCWAATGDVPPLVLHCSTNQVGKYQKVEYGFTLSRSYTNCFDPDEVNLSVELTAPGGKVSTIPAFWFQPYERSRRGGRDWMYPSGMPRWEARFSPQQTGAHRAVAVLKDSHGTVRSTSVAFTCLPSGSPGFVRVSLKDPRFFEFSEGQPFFPIGQNLAFIGNQQYVTLSRAEEIFGKLSENGANYLRIWTCCEDWAMAIEARKSAFGRSWDWRPPLVAEPDAEAAGRKCLKLDSVKNTVRIEPSHPVALRPDTDYVLLGRARLEGDASIQAQLNGKDLEVAFGENHGANAWREFKLSIRTEAGQWWLPQFALRLKGQGVGLVKDLSLKESSGGPELLWEADFNRPVRGFYNPLDSFMLDEIVSAAEKDGIYLQLCYLTRDVYMSALKNSESPEYARAILDARKALRYAVARWGYSTSVAAWEYWNEMDPGLPTDRFYAELGSYLQENDPFHHLRTTSTWGPSSKDCKHEQLDIADVHFYLRPADKGRLQDEVHAVLERTHWIRQQAPAKPVHLGEFGIANDKWQPTEEMNRSREIVDFHNALWASALSGASGTAMFWWWDRLDQRSPYREYGTLSPFIAGVPWNSGEVQPAKLSSDESRLRLVGLRAGNRVWTWVFDRHSSWQQTVVAQVAPTEIKNASLTCEDMPQARYQIEWYDTRTGSVVQRATAETTSSHLKLTVPPFERDIACFVRPQ